MKGGRGREAGLPCQLRMDTSTEDSFTCLTKCNADLHRIEEANKNQQNDNKHVTGCHGSSLKFMGLSGNSRIVCLGKRWQKEHVLPAQGTCVFLYKMKLFFSCTRCVSSSRTRGRLSSFAGTYVSLRYDKQFWDTVTT